MVTAPFRSRWLALAAAMAVGVGGLLPTPHAHLDGAEAIVHAHAGGGASATHHDDGAAHDGAAFDHDGHRDAVTITLSYDRATRFALAFGAETVISSAAVPEAPGLRQPTRTSLLPTHDPPLRFTSSPAPPAAI